MQIVLATANPDKAREISDVLTGTGLTLTLVARPADVPDVEETEETLVGNARLKARALSEATGLAALADDTGLEVEFLGGAPGVYSARYAGPGATYADNVAKLLGALEGRPVGERRARFRTVVCLSYPDGRELIGEGTVDGMIAAEARGASGFGYDPVFVPDEGDGLTFAEMGADAKNEISHRGRAVRALSAELRRAE